MTPPSRLGRPLRPGFAQVIIFSGHIGPPVIANSLAPANGPR
jgi:hypothetical protein